MTNSYDAAGNPLPSYLDPAGNPLPAYPTGPTADQLPPPPIPSNTGLANYGFDMSQVLGEDQQMAQQAAQDAATPASVGMPNPLPALPLGGLALPYDTNAAAALPIAATTPDIPATASVAAPPVEKEQLSNDLVGNFLNWENQHLPGPLSTGINQVLENVIPTAGGMIGGRLGMLAGTAVGGPVGAVLGGLAGGYFGGQLAGEGQKAILKSLLGDQQYAEWENHLALQLKQDPTSAEVGQIVDVLPYLKAGNPIPALKLAGSLSKVGLSLTRAKELWNAADRNAQETLTNMAFGTGSQVGIAAFQQAQAGVFQPVQLAGAVVSGTILNTPTKFGRFVFGQPADKDAWDTAAQAVKAGQTQEELLSGHADAVDRAADYKHQWANLAKTREGLIESGKDPTSPEVQQYDELMRNVNESWKTQQAIVQQHRADARKLGYGELSDTGGRVKVSAKDMPAAIQKLVAQSPAASAAFRALSGSADVHIVGGAIRSLAMGLPVKDLDMTYGGDVHEIERILNRLRDADKTGGTTWVQTGDTFPVYRLSIKRGNVPSEVEIALHRDEDPNDTNNYVSGRGIPIERDLLRRSETVNAAAVNLNKGTLVDPHGAFRDIQSNALNTVHASAFRGDLSRIIRGLRFIAEGMDPTPGFEKQMEKYAPELGKALEAGTVKWEVIGQQFVKIFNGSGPGIRRALLTMQRTGVLHEIMPELDKTVGFNQKNPYHNQTLFTHSINVAAEAAKHTREPVARMGAFFHDIGKVATQVVNKENGVVRATYHGHQDQGALIAGEILTRFRLDANTVKEVQWYVSNHMFDEAQVLGGGNGNAKANPNGLLGKMEEGLGKHTKQDRNNWVRRRVDGLMAIREADRLNHKAPDHGRVDEMRAALEGAVGRNEPRTEHDLAHGPTGKKFGGNDIKEIMGIADGASISKEVGRSIGDIKAKLVEMVASKEIPNQYDALVEKAKELISGVHQQAETEIQGRSLEQPSLKPGFLDQVIAHAKKTGAEVLDPTEVDSGWIFNKETGLQIHGNSHMQAVGGDHNGMALMAAGAVRVENRGSTLVYHAWDSHSALLESKLFHDLEREEFANKINIWVQSATKRPGEVGAPGRGYDFTFEQFRANGFDLQQTLNQIDRNFATDLATREAGGAIQARSTVEDEEAQHPPEYGRNRPRGYDPEIEAALTKPGSINKPAIESLISEMKIEKGGETRAAAGMDPRMLKVLGGNLYQGDLGAVAIKEALQNAFDSVRGLPPDQRKINVSVHDNGLTVSDNGHGMLPEVATKEFVDIGGSAKPEGASGGFGIAKVALFANAENIHVQTVADDPATGKRIMTTLSGTGADWLDPHRGLAIKTEEVSGNEHTGTDLVLDFGAGGKFDPGEPEAYMQMLFKHMHFPVDLRYSVKGALMRGPEPPATADLSMVRTMDAKGSKIDVYIDEANSRLTNYPTYVVLNNGVPQFKDERYLSQEVELPAKIIFDVRSDAGPESAGYPFRPDRQGLRGGALLSVQDYLDKSLVADALKQQAKAIIDAYQKAPTIPNSRFKVIDMSGGMNPEDIDLVRNADYVRPFLNRASAALDRLVSVSPPYARQSTLDGISMGGNHLGVNVSGATIELGRNSILINPYLTFNEVAARFRNENHGSQTSALESERKNALDSAYMHYLEGDNYGPAMSPMDLVTKVKGLGETWHSLAEFLTAPGFGPELSPPELDLLQRTFDNAPAYRSGPEQPVQGVGKWDYMAHHMATQTVATLVHEMSHESNRGHEVGFSGVLTRLMGDIFEQAHRASTSLEKFFKENDYAAIKQLGQDADSFEGRMGENILFKHAGIGLATTLKSPASGPGGSSNGPKGWTRLEGDVRPGPTGEAGGLASSPERSRGLARVEQLTGEQHGIQPQTTGPAAKARILSEADEAQFRSKADEADAASAAEDARNATGAEPNSIAATEGTNGPDTATAAPAEPAPGANGTPGEPGFPANAATPPVGGSGDASAPRTGDLYPAPRGTESPTFTESIGPAEAAAGTTGNAGASGNGNAVERGAAAPGTAATAGTTGGTASAATTVGEVLAQLPAEVQAAAEHLGLDVTAPLDGELHIVPTDQMLLTPEEHAVSEAYNKGSGVGLDTHQLYLDQNARGPKVTPRTALDNINKLADALGMSGLPLGMHDDASLIALILKGWNTREWFKISRAFLTSQEPLVQNLAAALGEHKSVYQNAYLLIDYLSRVKSGFLGPNLEERDHYMDNGVVRKDGDNRISMQNLRAAISGLDEYTAKIGEYHGALVGEEGSPPDRWVGRILLGSDKWGKGAGAYAVGRMRYLARALGVPPEEIQAALWTGYKALVEERLPQLLEAARDRKAEPEIAQLLKQMPSPGTLTNADDFGKVYRERFGINPGDPLPRIDATNVMARFKAEIDHVIANGLVRYRYLKIDGLPHHDVTSIPSEIKTFFQKHPDFQDALAQVYKDWYLETEGKPSGLVTAQQDFGPAMEELAVQAYVLKNNIPEQWHSDQKLAALDLFGKAYATPVQKFSRAELQNAIDGGVLRTLLDRFDPHGILETRLDNSRKTIAWISADDPYTLHINPDLAANGKLYSIVATELANSLQLRKKDFTPAAFARLQKDLARQQAATAEDVVSSLGLHEGLHAILDRVLGLVHKGVDGTWTMPNLKRGQVYSLWEKIPDEVWIELVRGGLANEVEALSVINTGKSLNEHFTGKIDYKASQQMDPVQAAVNINEALVHYLQRYFEDPLAYHNGATEETQRRTIHDPKAYDEAAQIIGRWFEDRLRSPEVTEQLAVEARDRSGIREQLDRGTEVGARTATESTDESATGIDDAAAADQASLDPEHVIRRTLYGDQLHDLTTQITQLHDAGDEAGAQAIARDHKELSHFIQYGKSLFTPQALRNVQNVDRDAIARRTEDAAKIERQPNETALQYGEKLAKAAGYESLDHAREILRMANTDYFAPVVRAGKIFTQIGRRTYEGAPVDHAIVWHEKFRAAIEGDFGREVAYANAQEPSPTPVGGIHGDRYFEALHEPEPILSEPSPMRTFVPKTIEEAHQMRESARINSEMGKIAQEIHGEEGSFGPVLPEIQGRAPEELDEAVDTGIKNQADIVKAGADASAPVIKGPPSAPPQDILAQIPGSQYSKKLREALATERAYRDFGGAFHAAYAHPDVKNIADGLNGLVTEIAKGWNFEHISSHPVEWLKATVYHIRAMEERVDQITRDIQTFIAHADLDANERIRQAIDAPDEPERQNRLKGLADNERAVAELFHHFYQLTGNISTRHGLLKAYLENYLPHMIDREEGTKQVVAGRNLKKTTYNAIQRLADHATGDIQFKTIEDLKARFEEVAALIDKEEGNAPGTTKPLGVKEDLASIFQAHGKGMATALVMRQMVDRMSTDLEVNHPTYQARPVVKIAVEGRKSYMSGLSGEVRRQIRQETRTVNMGPLKAVLEGYKVWTPLAEVMERLARTDEVTGPLAGTARFMKGINTIYKQAKFFSSPMHAWSMMSNISALTSNLGFGGLPPMFNPMIYKLLGNGGRILNDPARFQRALEFGIKAYEPPEGMAHSETYLEKIPLGTYAKYMHKLMWYHVGFKGQLGVFDFLEKQYTRKYMDEHGGQAPSEADQRAIGQDAAYQARRALGFLNELDMTKNWDLYGNASFLASRWTTSQLRTLGHVAGIKYLANWGGGERYGVGSAETQKMLQDKSIEASRRLLLGGIMQLFMTSMVVGTGVSALFNGGQGSTPIDNFKRDPLHTFDIYAGIDPQTQQRRWIHNNTFLFQRELIDYGLAGVKALLEGRNFGDALAAGPIRFAAKINPATAFTLEFLTQREIGRMLYGYSDPTISGDPAIKNIRLALDKAGVQDFGSLEDSLIFAIRQLSPSPNFPYNPTSANETSRIGDALGIGQFVPTPENRLGEGLWTLAGSRETLTAPPVINPETGQEESVGTHYAEMDARKVLITQMIDAINGGDWNTGLGISKQLNLTPGQFKEYVLYGNSNSTERGILQSTVKPAAGAQKVVNISGTELTPAQQVEFYNIEEQRMATVMKAVTQTPQWSKMTTTQMHALANDWTIFTDKLSQEQYGQQIGARPKIGLTSAGADQILSTVATLEQHVFEDLLNSPSYKNVDPAKQEQLILERSGAVKNAVWQQNFGNLKGATNFQIEQMVNVQEAIADQTRAYVPNLNLFKSGTMPYEQQAVLTNALAYAKQVTSDALSQKIRDKTMNRPLRLSDVWPVIKNGLVLQDTALTMLHKSQMYTTSDPATQTNLDLSYSNFAHRLVLYDVRGGIDLTNETDIFHAGFGQSLQSKLMADEGYKQLEDSYPGGKAGLDAHARELAGLKQRFAQERGAPTSRLAQYDNLITQWYYQQHPDYYNFIQARTQWEERNPLGQLWLALRRDELNFAAQSPDASFAANLLAQSA